MHFNAEGTEGSEKIGRKKMAMDFFAFLPIGKA